jgi:hypothetical protein
MLSKSIAKQSAKIHYACAIKDLVRCSNNGLACCASVEIQAYFASFLVQHRISELADQVMVMSMYHELTLYHV